MEGERYQPSPEEQMTDEQREQSFESLQARMENGEMSDDEIASLGVNDFLQLSSFLKGTNGEQGGKLIREELDEDGTIKLYRLPDGSLGREKVFTKND